MKWYCSSCDAQIQVQGWSRQGEARLLGARVLVADQALSGLNRAGGSGSLGSWMSVGMRQRQADSRLNRQGRESAKDSADLKDDMMLVLALEILDISDQLPLEAVDSSARDVKFWKAFALEAGKCTSYAEVGSFLPRLHAKILPAYISPNWMRSRYHGWKADCERSESASSVEALTQELIGVVLWDKVKKLWNSANQSELTSSDWQHWKGTIFEGLQQQVPAGNGKSEAQVQNFPGVENAPVRARGPNFATGLTLMNVTGHDTTLSQGLPTNQEHAVEVPACDTGHLPGSSYPSTPVSLNESGDRICIGITKHGVQCTHKTKGGAFYCGKHAHPSNTNENQQLERSEDDFAPRADYNQDTGGSHKRKRSSGVSDRHSPVTPAPITAGSQEDQGRRSHLINAQGICRGWSRRTNAQCARRAGKFSLYCQKHMKSCDSIAGNDVNSEVFGDRVTGMAADSSSPKEQKDLVRAKDLLHGYLSAAGNLSENGIFEAKKESLIHEASSDLSMAQSLLSLACVEQERLRELSLDQRNTTQPESSQACITGDCDLPVGCFVRHVESSTQQSDQKFSVAEDAMGEPCVIVTAQRQLLKCALCEGKFDQISDLSIHWSLKHEKQASLFLKGFGCRVCRFEASSSLVIERHWQKLHKRIPLDWPCWSICISCENLFANQEELWQHVSKSHAEQLSRQVADGGPDAWKPFQCTVEGGQPEGTWRCTTSYKDVMSGVELSGPEDGERADNAATSFEINEQVQASHQLEACQPRALDKSKCDPDHIDPGCGMAPDCPDHYLLAHVSPKRVKEKKGASRGRGRGRGRKMIGRNGRRQNNGTDSDTPARSSELLLKRRRFKLTSRGQFENQEEGTSGVGGDADQRVVSQSTGLNSANGAPCNTEQGSESRHSEGNIGMEECQVNTKDDVQDWSLTPPPDNRDAKFEGDVAIDENRGNSKTSLLCSEELDASASKARCIVLSQDISSGQEPVLVPCVVDIDVLQPCTCALCQDEKEFDVSKHRPWESFVYVTKRRVDPSLGIDTKEFQLGCSCGLGNCVPELCDHVKMFDNDNHDACDLHGHPMRGRFPYDKDGRIIVQEGFLVYECNTSCHCSEQCDNRVLQNGVRVKLEVYKTKHKGWAVRAAQAIPQGAFVCEYIGEVLNNEEANKRGQRYDQLGCSYLYDIDVHLDISDGQSSKRQRYVIDATKYGNVSRFINHSCSPNLVNYQVLIESMDCRLAHIGLYASQDIAVGEELAYDYRYKLLPGKGCLCQCGSATCRGRLY